MPRKDKLSPKERDFLAFSHCEQYLVDFITRYQRPRRQLPLLAEAIKEIGQIRSFMQAEVEDLVLAKPHGNKTTT